MSGINKSLKRKRSYSGDVVRATLRAFKSAKKFVDDHPGSALDPMKVAQETSGGASKRQVYRWFRSDNTDTARKKRLRKRGATKKIKIECQWLAVGHVLNRRAALLSVHRKEVAEFFLNHLHLIVHHEYVSKMLGKFGITVQRILPRESRMTDEQVVRDAIELIAEIRREKWKPRNTFIMDETGLWSNDVGNYTYNIVNSYDFHETKK